MLKLALIAVLSLTAAFADTVIANGVGPLPGSAQDLTADNNLTTITGALNDPYGVSVFAIDILNYSAFSATLVPASAYGIPDTELFLFDSTGRGVYGNDDISGADTLSCLPSADAGNPCPYGRSGAGPTSDGTYYLAITRSANGPLSTSGEIFSLAIGAANGPDLNGGGADPVIGWDGGVFTSPDFDLVNYSIELNGTSPEPASWTLIAFAGLALVLQRRSRAAAK